MTPTQQENDRRTFRVVTTNRRALHDYQILESLEVGIELTGTEIKSIRNGKISLTEAYARIDNGELWLIGAHISPYETGAWTNHDPLRRRKLLAHKEEIRKLKAQVEQKGLTLVPLRVVLKEGKAKLDVGVGRGKKLYDKRQDAAERESSRDIARALRSKSDE